MNVHHCSLWEYTEKHAQTKTAHGRTKYFRVAFATFVWQDGKMCMKCHIWPFQTSLGKMFLLCMQNLSTAHHQKTTQCSISISKHKGKMTVKSWKKSCTCVWKSIRQGMEAWVTESGGSRWKGWLWWCCHVFWTWSMVSNLAKTAQFLDTKPLRLKHAQDWGRASSSSCTCILVPLVSAACLFEFEKLEEGAHTNRCL